MAGLMGTSARRALTGTRVRSRGCNGRRASAFFEEAEMALQGWIDIAVVAWLVLQLPLVALV